MTSKRTHSALPALAAVAAGGIAAACAARTALRFRRRIDLSGKTVLITGSSRGLGLIIARAFLDVGSNVVICARGEADLQRAEQELANRYGPGRVWATVRDVAAGREAAESLVDDVVRQFGSIDVLVNNAATIQVGPQETMTEADYQEAMNIIFWAPLHLGRAAVPHMQRQGGGRIVNIASIGGKVAVPHLLPYTAGKFALVGYSEGLRAELAKENIFVTTVCPGLITTGSPRNVKYKGQHEKEYAWFAASDALPALAANPEPLGRRIVSAARHGDAEVIWPLRTWLQVKLYQMTPGLAAELSALANEYLLPAPGGIGQASRLGYQSDASLQPALARHYNEMAARKNNEVG